MIFMMAGFVCTLVTSILFSGAEFAVGFISRDSLEKLAGNRVHGAALILELFKNKRRFQLMLITGRIISIVGGTLFLSGLFARTGSIQGLDVYSIWLLTLIAGSAVFVVIDSLLARLAALGEYENVVSRFAYFLIVFNFILFPVTFVLDKVSSVFIKRNVELAVKEEALLEFVKSESEDGVIEQDEKDMIERILGFSETTVREVMVPRIDVVAAKKGMTVEELIHLFEEEGHSRIPVYEGRMDNIIGVLYAKDILPEIARKGKENCRIEDIMRKAYFVPETKMIADLLKEFKKSKVHIAIVVDEYGGTAGIVALEDLLEEIVGEIQDEYDEEEQETLWLNDTTVMIDAGLNIGDINEMIHTSIPDENFDTLGGFLYHQLGIIPKGGEIVEWENVTFTIKEIIGNRISKVLVTLKEPAQSEEESE